MLRTSETDTIAAIATPIGEGGISVIRVSGPQAIDTADKGFRGNRRLHDAPTQSAHFGQFLDSSQKVLDDVIALVFRGPQSYTGEDVVEVSCHGGVHVTKSILDAVLESGARLAQPGEFTKRAFLNGKLDLSQAEAVADLIHASSNLAHRSSMQQLKGRLSKQINSIRDELIETVGLLELELDFAEEQLEFLDKNKVVVKVETILTDLHALSTTYQEGRVFREGVRVVLAGAPNAGKSSILNCLLNEDRAIVSETPGTTRDIIEESLNLGGLLFRLIDTAGLRDTDDPVEQEGVNRTNSQVESSDVLIYVFDSSRKPTDSELEKAEEILLNSTAQAKLVALNKTDKPPALNGELYQKFQAIKDLRTVKVSALTGAGIDNLKKLLTENALLNSAGSSETSVTVTNLRHYLAIKEASESLELAAYSLREGKSGELVAVDLRASLERLGEITGAVTTDDILNNVFAKFCIGK